MRILVVSDSHGNDHYLEKVICDRGPYDLIFHLGDVGGSEDYIRALSDCPCMMVAGNNDWMSDLDFEMAFSLGSHKVFLCHGHQYHVSYGIDQIKGRGIELGADLIFFGHTHQPFLYEEEGIYIANPGSISRPRQEGRRPTYLLLEIDEKEKVHFNLNYL